MTQTQTSARAGKQRPAGAGKSRAQPPFPVFDASSLAEFNGRNMEAAMRMGQAMFDGMTSMNQQFMNFISTRIQEDMEAARCLADCRHPSDFVDADVKWRQTLVQQYAENTNKMLGIAAGVLRHGMTDVEDVMSDISKLAESEAA